MQIIPYDHRIFGPLHQSMGRWFHEPLLSHDPADRVWFPAADVAETEKEFTITADLPEMDRGDIEIQVQNSTLTMKGERQSARATDDDDFHRRERSYGKFSRSFGLPDNANAERIHAKYDNGVLEIHVPKIEATETAPKKITVG